MKLTNVVVTFILFIGGLHVDFVNAYSGNVSNVGALIADSSKDTGFREWVELKKTGNLLIGIPKDSVIELITIYAEDIDDSHLILREINLPGNRKSLFFSAPPMLSKKVKRATFYVNQNYSDFLIYHQVDGAWEPIEAQEFKISENGHLSKTMYAFSVNKLGLYWVVNRDTLKLSANETQMLSHKPSSLLGGSVSRSLFAFQCSILLLILIWSISRWVHNFERSIDK